MSIVSPKSSARKKENRDSLLVPNLKTPAALSGIRKILYED